MHQLHHGALEDSHWNQDHDVGPPWLVPILLHTTCCGHHRHTWGSDVCRHQSQSIPCYHGHIQTIWQCLSAQTLNGINHPCTTNGTGHCRFKLRPGHMTFPHAKPPHCRDPPIARIVTSSFLVVKSWINLYLLLVYLDRQYVSYYM